jgi:hypothetical protein
MAGLAGAIRLLVGLPTFLRRPITPVEARQTLRGRLARREADFLALARSAIFEYAESPYRQLLRAAGCEYGDLERLVAREGLEGALGFLYQQGVYLTVDEFKGRRAARRGSATFQVDPSSLRNPLAAGQFQGESSGSRGPRTQVPISLASVRDQSVDVRLAFDARAAVEWCSALWLTPGSVSLVWLLQLLACGIVPARWFTQVDAAASGLAAMYSWSPRAVRWASLLAGKRLPAPRHVPLTSPLPVARWMEAVLRSGGTPHAVTFASSAVRLCLAARDAGLDLRGARFTLIGEPATAFRQAAIQEVGAVAAPYYATVESGTIAFACLAPDATDELHLSQDLHAMVQVQPGCGIEGLPAESLLLSSLRPTARFILLNFSTGDQAVMGPRDCGCPLESLGWGTHLHTLRSYEKLTTAGVTFHGADVIRVLEQVLPARFGGGPTDYQLLEEETADGRPRVRLLVHPRLGPLDHGAVADAFLAALGGGDAGLRVAELLWRQAVQFEVERREPRQTASGKIQHLHQERYQPARDH